MDAVNNSKKHTDKYKIYFGGSYEEHWSEDGTLQVKYSDRSWVEAEQQDGRWIPVGGDEELVKQLLDPACPKLTQDYFQAAATVYAAIHDCYRRGLGPDALGECCSFEKMPIAAPELVRILMDDCGFSLETAYRVAAFCCDELTSAGLLFKELLALQPRTAHVAAILRRSFAALPAVYHNSRKEIYRSIPGAVETGSTLRLSFIRKGGKIRHAELVLWADGYERRYDMEVSGREYYARIELDEVPRAMWYAFYIETESSAQWLCPDHTGFIGRLYPRCESGFRLTVYKRGFDTPKWFRRSVMYQIFPDRFAFSDDDTAKKGVEYHLKHGQTPELHKSLDEPLRWQPRSFEQHYSPDDFYGGTFKGIEQKLPYLKELGISCIYLNPIVEARSNHRYDASDYSRPDPILGTTEDFEQLCKKAEEQGMRIILDGVFSHTGCDSIYFNRYGTYDSVGACQGPESQYYPWYDFRHFPDEYKCWWGFKDLPEVNENNLQWQKDVITDEDSVVKLWLKRGAAGWRLDVADELPDHVLEMIREHSKAVSPDAPIIGEVWEDAVIKESYGGRRTYALGTALDSVMNYPLRVAALDFIHHRQDAYALRNFLVSQQMNYPKPMYYALMNLLGSHDVDRLRNALAVSVNLRSLPREEQVKLHFSDKAMEKALSYERLCAALQFSIPGVPSIYYGDEQGMAGVNDPFNRGVFKEGDKPLHDFYAELAKQRNAAPALSTGHAQFMTACRDVLLILRYITDGKDAFGEPAENGVYLTVINRGEKSYEFTADCSAAGLEPYSGSIAPVSAEIIRLK